MVAVIGLGAHVIHLGTHGVPMSVMGTHVIDIGTCGIDVGTRFSDAVAPGMHSHRLGYPFLWECIPTYWGTTVYGDAFP
jgi:hypothetical protein